MQDDKTVYKLYDEDEGIRESHDKMLEKRASGGYSDGVKAHMYVGGEGHSSGSEESGKSADEVAKTIQARTGEDGVFVVGKEIKAEQASASSIASIRAKKVQRGATSAPNSRITSFSKGSALLRGNFIPDGGASADAGLAANAGKDADVVVEGQATSKEVREKFQYVLSRVAEFPLVLECCVHDKGA